MLPASSTHRLSQPLLLLVSLQRQSLLLPSASLGTVAHHQQAAAVLSASLSSFASAAPTHVSPSASSRLSGCSVWSPLCTMPASRLPVPSSLPSSPLLAPALSQQPPSAQLTVALLQPARLANYSTQPSSSSSSSASPSSAAASAQTTTNNPTVAAAAAAATAATKPDPLAHLEMSPFQKKVLALATRILGVNLQQVSNIRYAKDMYEVCLLRSLNAKDFYSLCKLPDTVNSWFMIAHLHLWMCLVALKSAGEAGKGMSKELTNIFWEDVEHRIRLAGITSNAIVSSSLKELVSLFYGCAVALDEGIMAQDDAILAAALWRNMFSMKGSAVEVASLTRYVRHHMKQLEDTPIEDLLQGKVRFGPLSLVQHFPHRA